MGNISLYGVSQHCLTKIRRIASNTLALTTPERGAPPIKEKGTLLVNPHRLCGLPMDGKREWLSPRGFFVGRRRHGFSTHIHSSEL